MPVASTSASTASTASGVKSLPASQVLPQQPQMPVNQGFYNPLHGTYIQRIEQVPVSVIGFGGKCTAYNTNNQIVNIPVSDCKAYLANGVYCLLYRVSRHIMLIYRNKHLPHRLKPCY